eukprot:GEMP01081192.1.p1 GENE.GEMP01081192.1~~GEMP01081192.1.p1  ORF type:complete len:290 (+),score=56.49 GEMP01081192.1:179-1048(+)
MAFFAGGASQYHLSRIKVVYTSKLKQDLETSIANLRRSDAWRLQKQKTKDRFVAVAGHAATFDQEHRSRFERFGLVRENPTAYRHVEETLERLCVPHIWAQEFMKYARTLEVHKEHEGSIVLAAPDTFDAPDAKWYSIQSPSTVPDYLVLPREDDAIWSQFDHHIEPHTVIRRLPRRAWRVSYLKSPFKYKKATRHYIFHDWRYEFEFWSPPDPEQVVSRILGSAAPDTSSVVHFSWHYSNGDPLAAAPMLLEKGRQGVLKQVQLDEERSKGWYHHTTFWNNVGKSGGT